MDGKWKLCVICSSNSGVKDDEQCTRRNIDGNDITSITQQSNLANVFKLLVKSSPHHRSNQSRDHLENTFRNLENANFAVCSECNAVTTGALESRLRGEQVEMEVRVLQLRILEMLKGLQEEIEVFQGEMSKIARVVKESENMPCWTDEGRVSADDAVIVRDEILEVVTDLRFYQADLQDKLVTNRMEDQTMFEVSTAVEVDFSSMDDGDVESDTSDIDQDFDEVNYENHGDDDEVDDELDDSHHEEDSVDDKVEEPNMLYVGHMVGLRNPTQKSNQRPLRKRLPFRSGGQGDHHSCSVCGSSLPTQNKLTRHYREAHGLAGRWAKPKLHKPAQRFNSQGLSQEMLSKALLLINNKTGEERKKARKKKLPINKAHWKILKKSIKQQQQQQSLKDSNDDNNYNKGPKDKSTEQQQHVPPKRLNQMRKNKKESANRVKVPAGSKVSMSKTSFPLKKKEATSTLKKKTVKSDEGEDDKEPVIVPVEEITVVDSKNDSEPVRTLRRSTRGQGILNIKDVVLKFMGKERKSCQQITEKET